MLIFYINAGNNSLLAPIRISSASFLACSNAVTNMSRLKWRHGGAVVLQLLPLLRHGIAHGAAPLN